MDNATCAGCGTSIARARRRGLPLKWCTEACRVKSYRTPARIRSIICAGCSTAFDTTLSSARWCSRRCQQKAAQLARVQPQDFTCVACGEGFTRVPVKGTRPLRCSRCRLRVPMRPETRRRNDAIRRARKRGARVEVFSPAEVFDRDGWACGICAEPVDAALAWPDPLSVSLDHVVPLSRGGEHSRANTRCAHLVCNTRRGNRTEVA